MAPVTFDGDSRDPRALEHFYRSFHGAPWRQAKTEFLSDPLNAQRTALILERLERIAPDSLLDAGCGGGVLAGMFAERHPGSKCYGLDLNPPSQGTDNPAFIAGDIRALPFGDQTLQCAVCSETIEHLADPDRALAELRRALAPGARLLITVPNLFCLDSLEGRTGMFHAAGRALHRAGVTSRFRNGINTHLQKLPSSAWEKIITLQGFAVEYQQPVYIFPYIPYFIGPAKALEKKLLSPEPAARALRALDGALRFAPLGQLHFFECSKR